MSAPPWLDRLREGVVIPAHPLALTAGRRLDERHQRALTRYYVAAGAGGVAVGVHTTQFAIRDPAVGLYRPVLELAADTLDRALPHAPSAFIRVAGIAGPTGQAVAEARVAADLGYHTGLVSLGALRDAAVGTLVDHVRAVSEIIPVFAFYLQPAVGGRALPRSFWQRLLGIERLVAIKIAPFDRYQTIDVVRAVAESGRAGEIALYTGNDDHILLDLLTTYRFPGSPPLRMTGGVLGHWAVWTHTAVAHHGACAAVAKSGGPIPEELVTLATQVTDANAAIFDAANGYAGCIAGIHEVLRRQGLLGGIWCLDPAEGLSPGQSDEIDRVVAQYPHLADDAFVSSRLDGWLA